MATAVAFDTLKLARKLEAAGFGHKQAADTAEAMAIAELVTKADLRESELRLEAKIDHLEAATKADSARLEAKISAVESKLEAKIRESELRLEAKLGETKADVLKWVAGLLLAQAAVIAALVKLL